MTLTRRQANDVIDLLVTLQAWLAPEYKGLRQNPHPFAKDAIRVNRSDWRASERLIKKLKKELRP